MIVYRVCWAASSNISFRGATDWLSWDDEAASADDVEAALNEGGAIPPGLEIAVDGSGFEWWIETREEADDAD